MRGRCGACPVEGTCLAELSADFGHFCGRAAEGQANWLAMIRDRAEIGIHTGERVPMVAMAAAPAVEPSRWGNIPLAGDLIEKAARRLGADRLARWWTRVTGAECGCAERKERLNRATKVLVEWLGLKERP